MFSTPGFLQPAYGNGCFADLPMLIRHWLTGQALSTGYSALPERWLRRYDAVIFVLADGFGWRFFEGYAAHSPALRRFVDGGSVLKWTAQFPSTTAAHVTCLHSGLPPGQSGVYEWQFYEPSLDAVVEPLPFSFAGDDARETLAQAGVHPATLLPAETIYQQLGPQGITSLIFQHREYTPSAYTNWMMRGATVYPFMTLPEALVNLRLRLAQTPRPAYAVLYYDKLDSISHRYGPTSPQLEAEIENFLFSLERALLQPLQGKAQRTLLVVTADHGHVEVDPRTTIYLNTDARCQGLLRYFRTNRRGEPLLIGGSPRDAFLYIQPDRLAEAQRFLAERLAGQAEVVLTQTLIEAGYFGPLPLSPRFLARVGNLLVLPYAGESVWWYEKDRFEQRYYGHHGGLTPQEMEIPLCLYEFVDS